MTDQTTPTGASERGGGAIPARYRGLLAVNLVALALLCIITFASDASGQPARSRAAGEYTMVSGEISSTTQDAIYIIDSRNREMLVLVWDRSRRQLQPIGGGYRNFDADSSENARRSR